MDDSSGIKLVTFIVIKLTSGDLAMIICNSASKVVAYEIKRSLDESYNSSYPREMPTWHTMYMWTCWVENIMTGEIRNYVFFECAIRRHYQLIIMSNESLNSYWTKRYWYSDYYFASFHDLRQGCRMEFFSIYFSICLFFFMEKPYHSNWAIKFILDHLWPNGFEYHIDQPRNCPFGFPDDRWRHHRLRNRLL